jgi:hypothetical protein
MNFNKHELLSPVCEQREANLKQKDKGQLQHLKEIYQGFTKVKQYLNN